MENVESGHNTNNPDPEKKVCVTGNVFVEFDKKGIGNIAAAIHNETTT